jgi:hypothetical protein
MDRREEIPIHKFSAHLFFEEMVMGVFFKLPPPSSSSSSSSSAFGLLFVV